VRKGALDIRAPWLICLTAHVAVAELQRRLADGDGPRPRVALEGDVDHHCLPAFLQLQSGPRVEADTVALGVHGRVGADMDAEEQIVLKRIVVQLCDGLAGKDGTAGAVSAEDVALQVRLRCVRDSKTSLVVAADDIVSEDAARTPMHHDAPVAPVANAVVEHRGVAVI